MKFCDECGRDSIIENPAEYIQEWTKGAGTGVIIDMYICEDHLIDVVDKGLLALGYTLTLRRIDA